MAMSVMIKWQKSNEKAMAANAKAKQRRRDIQDLKNAGVWQSPEELYLDEYGHTKPDAPSWFKSLCKAWQSNRALHESNKALKAVGHAPAKRKRKKKNMDIKTRKVKIKRSVQLKVLLQEYGVVVNDAGTITGYDGFEFLKNGRIRTPNKDVISVIQFIHDYV